MGGFYVHCFALLGSYNIKDLDQGFTELTVIQNNWNCLLKQHNSEKTYYLNTCCIYYRSFTIPIRKIYDYVADFLSQLFCFVLFSFVSLSITIILHMFTRPIFEGI